MDTPARAARMVAAAVTAVLVLAVAGACGGGKADSKKMTDVAAGIQATLAQHPDVANAEVVYQDNITANGSALADITVKSGSDYEPVIDDALRLIWQSTFDALHSITIGVTDAQNSRPGTTCRIDADQDKDDLNQKTGRTRPSRRLICDGEMSSAFDIMSVT